MLTLLLSIISGGLAGGIVSAISNRIFHWRALRTQFYPKLSNMYSDYIIRFCCCCCETAAGGVQKRAN